MICYKRGKNHEHQGNKQPHHGLTTPTQAALVACEEFAVARLIPPHARGNMRMKQQKKVDVQHYAHHYLFVQTSIGATIDTMV